MLGARTLFVNPPLVGGIAFTRQGRCQEREEVLGTTKPPYTLALGAALFRDLGCDVRLVDLTATGRSVEDLIAELDRTGFAPTLILFPSTTPTLDADVVAMAKLKARYGAPLFCFGPHASTAPGVARAFLRCATEEWGVDDDLAQDAAMVITELVANAVDHARTESTLSIGVAHGGLCVSVRDTRPGPVLRPAPIDPTAARGRGLQMVDALTSAWGVTLQAGGKTVWAVLGPDRA